MKQYWLCLFTGTSWQQYLSAERPEVGFNKGQMKQAQKMRPGDKIIAYLTKVSRFIGVLEVTSEAIVSNETKWTEGLFPVRYGATSTARKKLGEMKVINRAYLKMQQDLYRY